MSVNIVNLDGSLSRIAGGTLYADNPIGSIIPYGGAAAPNGFLLCQGQAVSRVIYAELFAVIGTTYGSGDDSTTFNLPDLRETIPVGVDENNTQTIVNHDVYTLGEFKDDSLGQHNHPLVVTTRATYNTAGVPVGVGNNNTPTTATHGKQLGVNYIIKAKQVPIPADFASSMIGYLGQETNYNLYPWSHLKPEDGADINQDITIERDGWYSIDYTLSSNVDTANTFTFRDFDSQGDVHTIMRAYYDKSGTFRQTFLVPLKAGTYRYSHGGVGTLSVYMNRRDFA